MTALALLFTLSAIGVSETFYLIKARRAGERPACPITGGCHVVLESEHNKILGIHLDILGFIYYTLVLILSGYLVVSVGVISTALIDSLFIVLITTGALMSVYFTFLQWKVIRAWCFWCLMSAFNSWTMAIVLAIGVLMIFG